MKWFGSAMLVVFLLVVMVVPASAANDSACWGQASAVYAQMGEMGEHSSSFESPRMGLRNLARYLYSIDAIPDDSMASLGVFVAEALELEIEACMR
jgi:hypothetical protein